LAAVFNRDASPLLFQPEKNESLSTNVANFQRSSHVPYSSTISSTALFDRGDSLKAPNTSRSTFAALTNDHPRVAVVKAPPWWLRLKKCDLRQKPALKCG
jgi:hypothetical protein